jgi:hypothetical protein
MPPLWETQILQDSHNLISLKLYHEPQSCLFLFKASYILKRFQVGITEENKPNAISYVWEYSPSSYTNEEPG